WWRSALGILPWSCRWTRWRRSSPWWWRGSTTRWRACWRSGFPRFGGGCCWGLGLVVRPGTRSIDALPGLKTGALRTNLVADGFRARLDEGPFRAQKRAPTALWGPLLFGIFSSTPLVPARFQASHVIAHPLLALVGRGLGPDHNASVHQAHRPGTAGRVGIHPHLPTVRSEEHTSELQSRENLVCRLLLEKKNN